MNTDRLGPAKVLWLSRALGVDPGAPSPGKPFDGVGPGFGTLSGVQVEATEAEVRLVSEHLDLFSQAQGPDIANMAMLVRLQRAMATGAALVGADAAFHTHELKEAELMKQHLGQRGLAYNAQNVVDHYYDIHEAALKYFGVSPWALYHPEAVAEADADAGVRTMNPKYYEFWGIR